MTLSILTFVLGPLGNNTYLVADETTRLAAVIDPSFGCDPVIQAANNHHWQVTTILLTHAHFDHLAGVGQMTKIYPGATIYLHSEDVPIYQQQGGAPQFGFSIEELPPQTLPILGGQMIALGSSNLEVRHTPGHTRGHVIFYSVDANAAFVGDLVFAGSVGRTDLPGGSSLTLVRSIRQSVLTLPSTTRLLCGHGPETTVQAEIESNPFI